MAWRVYSIANIERVRTCSFNRSPVVIIIDFLSVFVSMRMDHARVVEECRLLLVFSQAIVVLII